MARRLHTQRRGKGSNKYTSRKDCVAKARYTFNYTQNVLDGEVVELLHNSGKTAPLARILLENNTEYYTPASEGMYIGMPLQVGKGSNISLGSVMPLKDVPSGFVVYNIECKVGRGGNFCRSGGTYGLILGNDEKGVYVKMNSGQKKLFDPNCLCTLGVVAGGGRSDKPFMKAGNKMFSMKAKGGRLYPVVRGYAMNAVDHPHGGSGHNSAGRQKNVSKKFGAPGQKVGHVGPKRTGRKKR